jgi:hypothetical protein
MLETCPEDSPVDRDLPIASNNDLAALDDGKAIADATATRVVDVDAELQSVRLRLESLQAQYSSVEAEVFGDAFDTPLCLEAKRHDRPSFSDAKTAQERHMAMYPYSFGLERDTVLEMEDADQLSSSFRVQQQRTARERKVKAAKHALQKLRLDEAILQSQLHTLETHQQHQQDMCTTLLASRTDTSLPFAVYGAQVSIEGMTEDDLNRGLAEISHRVRSLQNRLNETRSQKNRCLWRIASQGVELRARVSEGYTKRQGSVDMFSHLH